jgi:dipeptidase
MPCISVFIPFFFGTNVLETFTQPSSQPDESLWWVAERVHQWVCKDYQNCKQEALPDFFALQEKFLKTEARLMETNPTQREMEEFSRDCLENVRNLYLKILSEIPGK